MPDWVRKERPMPSMRRGAPNELFPPVQGRPGQNVPPAWVQELIRKHQQRPEWAKPEFRQGRPEMPSPKRPERRIERPIQPPAWAMERGRDMPRPSVRDYPRRGAGEMPPRMPYGPGR
jgi:hypothetical protein